ncbi:MAG: hypothetical protein WC891_05115 [Actinomycetota bacterium]
MKQQNTARISALIYSSISFGLAGLFVAATYLNGKGYPPVARWGGFVWVTILSLIITMPLVIPRVKKYYEAAA